MWAGFTRTPRGLRSVFFAVFVESGSVMCMAGIAGIFLLALFSLLLSSGPRCLSSWRVWIEGQLHGEMQPSVTRSHLHADRARLPSYFMSVVDWCTSGKSLGADWWL